MFGVFDAAGYAQLIAPARTAFLLSFRQRLRIWAWDRWSAGRNATIKESDERRDRYRSGGYELWEFFMKFVLSFVSTEVCRREGETCVEESGYVSRSLEGGLR